MRSESGLAEKRKIKRPPPPKLIFGENHQDALSEEILLKLLPELEKLRYKDYFVENFKTLEENLFEATATVRNYFDSQWLDTTPSDLLAWFPQAKAQMELLSSLSMHNISYTPIDLEFQSLSEALDKTPLRDAVMSKAYLDAPRQVFGNVGLGHLPGIQKNILNSLGQKAAEQKFLFIVAASNKDLLLPFDSHEFFDELNIKKDAYVRHFADITGLELIKNLPLNCLYLNSDTMSVDEMCVQVIDAIKKHRMQYVDEFKIEQTYPEDKLSSVSNPLNIHLSDCDLPRVTESQSSLFANSTSKQHPKDLEEDLAFHNDFLKHYIPVGNDLKEWNPPGTITKEMAVNYATVHPESGVAAALTKMNIEFQQIRPTKD